jgi:hypothetical protein
MKREFLFRVEPNYKIEQEGYLSPWALAQVVNWWWAQGWGGLSGIHLIDTKRKKERRKKKGQMKRR